MQLEVTLIRREKHPNWGHPDHDACGTGFVARLGSPPSHDIVQYALNALERLTHRGGVDADGASGDGAGLLTSIPETFFRERAKEQGIDLPEQFGLGFAFFPAAASTEARTAIEAAADTERLRVLGWRRVPVNTASLGRMALETMPETWQFFVAPFHPARAMSRFEWRLALLRKCAESLLPERCYICSLSSQTIVYKGLLTPWQFPQFYEDLRDPDFATTFAVFHQRYSTNTSPSWDLAQPFRYTAHNGEINTIVSNRRWLRAKDKEIRTKLTVGPWFQTLERNVSDSASFDNAFELKLLEGFSPEAAMLAMVPPAFENDPLLSRDVRGALAAVSQVSEPWDGPAALVFSDGQFVGAKLDRNGLRPLRYTLTHDGLLIAGSETGLVDLDESQIAERQRLGPGEMILANPVTGTVFRWREILKRLATQQSRNALPTVRQLSGKPAGAPAMTASVEEPKRVAAAAGWTEDQFKILFSALPHGKEADWSMGDDAPPADSPPCRARLGLLQAALCTSHEPADRSPARIARDVAGGASAERRGFAESDHQLGAACRDIGDFWSRASHGFHFSCPNWSLGRAPQYCSAHYPSERRWASGPPPRFRSRYRSREGRASRAARNCGSVEGDGARRIVGCAVGCRIRAGL